MGCFYFVNLHDRYAVLHVCVLYIHNYADKLLNIFWETIRKLVLNTDLILEIFK